MGIPVVSEIWDGLRWVIDLFISKAPRPLQIIIFLLMLLLFSNVIIGMLHLIGVHCNESGEPVKTSFFDIGTNVWIFYDTTIKAKFSGNSISYSSAHPYVKYSVGLFGGDNCVFALKQNVNGTYEFCESINDTDCRYYYREEPEGQGIINEGCVRCNVTDIGWVYDPSQPVTHKVNVGTICSDDAYLPTNSPSIFTNIFTCNHDCKIPTHYKWSFMNGQYECIDLDYCGANATKEVSYEFNNRLKDAGATLIYKDSDTKSFDKAVYLKCNKDFNPRLTFFGIDVFDYKIWLLLLIIAVMVRFLTIMGQQKNL
jgi:hypothetical protein